MSSSNTESAPCPEFDAVKGRIAIYLDSLKRENRASRISELIHLLDYERRHALLAPNQLAAMNARDLRPAQIAELRDCNDPIKYSKLLSEMARLQYIIDCAWCDYLSGVTDQPPVLPIL